MGLIIVADDYGMSRGINDAITELSDKRIVSKVSVMASSSEELLENRINDKTIAGLHVHLTGKSKIAGLPTDVDITPLKLIYLTLLNKSSVDLIVDSIDHQFDVIRSRDYRVEYMDTHQHVHIIPRVLDSLIVFAKKADIKSIRCITLEKKYMLFYLYSLIRYGFLMQVPKMFILYFMGCFMKKKLNEAHIDYCENLILMPLATGGDYQGLLKAFIAKFRGDNVDAEIVSHPGFKSETDMTDSYNEGRFVEYQSLNNLKKL